MKKILAVLLVAAGIVLILYPHIASYYRDQRVEQSLEDFSEIRRSSEQREIDLAAGAREEKKTEGPMPVAVLEIDSIDLELPVFQGTSEYNLNYGAGLMEEQNGIGEKGTAVMTAHRAHTYGHLFNRLDEVGKGDEIVVQTKEENLTYVTVGSSVFDAVNTSYMACDGEEKRLVLITCHPLYRPNPPYRLVVQAEIK